MMLGFIKNLKVNTHINVKRRVFNKFENRKGWTLNSSALPHVLQNKTAVMNGYLLHSMPCSMVRSFLSL